MSQTVVDGALAPRDEVAPPRLVRPRREAVQMIVNHIKVGQAIAAQRMVYVDDLQQARREKQEWVTRTGELLQDLFGEWKLIEHMNDYVGPILPEYAQVDLFIEQFTNEMKHRMARLHGLAKRLSELPEAATVAHILANDEASVDKMRSDSHLTANVAEDEPAGVAPVVAAEDVPARAGPVGLLVLRSTEESVRQAISQFLAALNLSVHVIDQRAAEKSPLSDSLEPFDCESFAIILDDTGAQGDNLFDLGCCVGRFGPRRVCVLQAQAAPPAQNTFGVRHITIDPGGGWLLHLARHLKSGGAAIDLNRLV